MNTRLKTKIMELIIDRLTAVEDVKYAYDGYLPTYNGYIVSMDFTFASGQVKDIFNVWGNLEYIPVTLKAQYDNRTTLQDDPHIGKQIDRDLQLIANEINQIIKDSGE